MKHAVLLGLGQQGRAALHDLVHFGAFETIVAVDAVSPRLDWVAARYRDPRLALRRADLRAKDALRGILREFSPGVVIDLLPIQFIPAMARQAVEAGWHYVNTYYTLPALKELAPIAESAGVAVLPECGFDPGIDLVMAGHAFRQLETVTEYLSYGAGIPEPAACTNPLNYKITWIFEGVLNSYFRAARLVRDGRVVDIPPDEIFSPGNIHTVDIQGVGRLEAFPNGDAAKYLRADLLPAVRRAGRYAMRWPGHARFWFVLAKLGLLEDRQANIGGIRMNQRKVLADLLAPRLQYAENERDLAILRVEVAGRTKSGRAKRLISELVDSRDLESGLTAMSRTVGFTAAIGAQMIAEGSIPGRGLLNPWNDIPYLPFVRRLEARGIHMRSVPAEA